MREGLTLALAAPLLLSIGARGVAGHLAGRRMEMFLPLYCVLLVAGWVLTTVLFGRPAIISSLWEWAAATLLAIPIGLGCARADRLLIRNAWKRARYKAAGASKAAAPSARVVTRVPLLTRSDSASMTSREPQSPHSVDDDRTDRLFVNVGLGTLEELVYRGAVLQLASAMSGGGPLYWAAVWGATLTFALAHASFGLQHAYAKLPLAIACTVLALWQGVVPAVVCHVTFNAVVTSAIRRRRVVYRAD